MLGGAPVSAATLNLGHKAYQRYCQGCHGEKGDGLGPLGFHQNPRPHDLTKGIIKFASVPSGQLPTDADLERVIRRGLPGTAMLAWPIPDDDVRTVTQYIKTLSPRFQTELPGEPIAIPPEPAELPDGAELFATLGCARCHNERPLVPVPARPLWGRPLRGGGAPSDIYRSIAAGVGDTAMPSWQGALSSEQLWALAHYLAKRE